MYQTARALLWILPITLVATLVAARPASSELVAGRISEANFATHHVGGPDADAGIDDWFLSNGTICAAISDPDHESPISPRGGVLIDLGHCGRANDQWTVLQPMLNLTQSHVVHVSELDAGVDAGEAWIRTRAEFAGVEILTRYSLSSLEPNSLRIHSRARRFENGDRLFSVGTILLHPTGQTRPFSLLRHDPENSRGFRYPASDRDSIRSLFGAMSASDLDVLVGADGMPPISYGVEQKGSFLTAGEKARAALPSFSITGLHFTMVSALSRASWFGAATDAPGLLDFVRIPFMDLESGTVLESEIRVWVGERADVASITDQLWPTAPRVRGRVDDATARIHIETEAGAPVTQVRPDPSGAFALRLPAGSYRARARASAQRSTRIAFRVEADATSQTLPMLEVGAPAWVDLPSDFRGRLVFLSADAGRPLVFGDDLLGFQIGDDPIPSGLEAPFLNLAGASEDPERIAVPAGRYRVIAVRGPEYELSEQTLEALAGRSVALQVGPLSRVAETPGWIAADLHVHSGESFDSATPQTRQIAAFAASGAEVLIATEHDRIFDPRPALRATGLASQLVTITGVEVTSSFQGGDSPHSTGHWNAFPVRYQPRAYRGGAPKLEGRRAHDMIADIRRLEGAAFLQLNHPRPGLHGGEGDTYFSHLGVAGVPYDPTRPLTRKPNSVLVEAGAGHGLRDLDYDGVELMNGPDLLRYRRVRADWFSLLLQGEFKIATASSDSHRLGVIVGLPRTYVAIPEDSLAAFSETAFLEALGAARAYGTTGPLLEVRLDESGLGGLHRGPSGVLEIHVEAAPWVPIREWRAYVNGELVHRAPIAAGETAQLPLAFERDAFVTVEVEGPAEAVYAEALPGFVPFAFSNPIFVDVDGNGRFDAPGLPDQLPITLQDPDRED